MAILNPQHLFEQADRLIAPQNAGPPRQVDLRRAISAAYYGIFHAIIAAAADQFIGVTHDQHLNISWFIGQSITERCVCFAKI